MRWANRRSEAFIGSGDGRSAVPTGGGSTRVREAIRKHWMEFQGAQAPVDIGHYDRRATLRTLSTFNGQTRPDAQA